MNLKQFIKDLYTVEVKSGGVLNPSTFTGFNFMSQLFAGVKVTPKTALAHDTVYACIRDKAESIGQLPIKLKRTKGGIVENVTSGREHRIFTQKPNDYMSWQDMVEMIIATAELQGVWYAYISRNKYKNITEIVPFRYQGAVSANMDASGRVYYTYTTNDNKPDISFAGRDVLAIKLFTLDGFTPCSSIQYGARSLGIAISQEEYLSNLMKDGAMPKGILHTDQAFKDKDVIARLKEQWKEFSGTTSAGKTPILEQNLKYQALTMSPADAELILQRGFSREQVCGMLRVPTHRVGVASKAKVDVEQSNKDYYQNSLVPLVVKVENAINFVLPDGLTIKFDERGFIRGDFDTMVTASDKAVKAGLISINEGRDFIDLEPVEGGDVHAIDTNNLTFGNLTDIPKLQEEQRALAAATATVQNANNSNNEDEDNET